MALKEYDRKQNKIFALVGIFGGLICSVADYLLEYMGEKSEVLGSWGVVESAWEHMALWRFSASIWIACVAVPMYVLGIIAAIRQMRSTNRKLGTAFGASFLTGALGGLFIHIMLCVMPVAYKFLLENSTKEVAVATLDAMTDSFIMPFFVYYLLLIIIPAVLWCVYCFKKGGLYRPEYAIAIIGFTVLCIAAGKLVPALEFLAVGAISRMLAMWSFIAWKTEKAAER